MVLNCWGFFIFEKNRTMKKTMLIFLLLLTISAIFAQDKNNNPFLEPKNQFKVEVDSKEYFYSEGDELEINHSATKSKLKIELLGFKKFDSGTVSFHYPSNFAFEVDKDFGYNNWTFDGNNVVILYFEIDNDMKMQEYIDLMVEQFGKKNCKTEKKQIQLGNKTLSGTRINITLVGQLLSLEFFEIPLNDFKTRFIAFQDSKDEEGNNSKELADTIKMVNNTINFLEN
jgi:hypothetical protein